MPRWIILALLPLLSAISSAQFAQPELRARTDCLHSQAGLAYDADSDGDQDLLVANYTEIWLYHGDGTGNMGRADVVGKMNSLSDLPEFMDADQDGDPDLMGVWSGGGSAPDTMAWLANDGTGHFATKQHIAAPCENITAYELADMDGDGTLDAVFLSYSENILGWCANLGGMTFGPQQSLAEADVSGRMAIGDLDADGDNDLAYTHPGTEGYSWLRNQGDGSFATAQTFGGININWLMAADLDGDGDTDLLATSYPPAGLNQYTNDGSGDLAPAESLGLGGGFDGFADINNDGFLDGWRGGVTSNDYSAGYYPADGSGHFGAYVSLCNDSYLSMNFLSWGDLNSDGAMDMISMSYDDNEGWDDIWWRPNDGAGGYPLGNTNISQRMDAPRCLATGDLDGDGDEDLVAVLRYNGKASWLENTGTGFWAEHSVRAWGTGWTAAEQVNTGDADGDGDIDVLITTHDGRYTGTAYWNLNDGTGQFMDGPGFVGHATGYGRFRSVRADLNEDGLTDLLAFKDSVYYWENMPGSGFHYAVGLQVPEGVGGAPGDVGDVDGDGDVDIVLGGLYLLENLGDMTFSALQSIAEEATGPVVRLADIDGDGDPDIVAQAGNPSAVVWWENDGGYFIERHAVGPNGGTDYEFALVVEDLDGDGDIDIAAPLESDAPVSYLNRGDGTFDAPVLLREPGGLCSALCSADFNGDGLRDLAMGLDGTSIWTASGYGGSPYQLSGSIYIDADGDGIRDPGEAPLPDAQLLLDPPTGSASVNADGLFTALVGQGTYTITAFAPSEDWQPTAPVSHTVTVNSGTPTATGLDLGFWDPTPQDSLIASITPSILACAGHVPLWASVVNNGTTNVSASLRIGIDPLLDYVGAAPPPDAILGDTLIWNADTLYPSGTRTVAITVNMPGASFAGDPVQTGLRATGISLASGSPVWALASRTDTIACGGLSNVKICDPAGEGQTHRIPITTEYLDYTILFRNTGEDTAHTVMVRDDLPLLLLAEELVVTGACHAFSTTVDEYANGQSAYRFTFSGIDLPPQSTDPLGSQGFISLRLPVDQAHVQHGDYLVNSAYITFLGSEITEMNSEAQVVLADCDLVQPVIHDTVLSGEPYLYELAGPDAYDQYTWYRDGNMIFSSDYYANDADYSGLYTVEVTDLAGCVVMSAPFPWLVLGLDNPNPSLLLAKPNPATSAIHIIGPSPFTRMLVTDMTGRIVLDETSMERREAALHRNGLPPGLYHIQLRNRTQALVGTVRVIFE